MNILFKMSASIAAYKACDLISKLVQNQFKVQVACSTNTYEFVGRSTLEGLTGRSVFDNIFEKTKAMDHIELNRWAQLILLCPATANQINKMSAGIGDDPTTTLFLTHDFKKPYWVAPAMNEKMWEHPATRQSIDKLKNWSIKILEPRIGRQACGDFGAGRMMEPLEILDELLLLLKRNPSFKTTSFEGPAT